MHIGLNTCIYTFHLPALQPGTVYSCTACTTQQWFNNATGSSNKQLGVVDLKEGVRGGAQLRSAATMVQLHCEGGCVELFTAAATQQKERWWCIFYLSCCIAGFYSPVHFLHRYRVGRTARAQVVVLHEVLLFSQDSKAVDLSNCRCEKS